jgi:hypothetical protein
MEITLNAYLQRSKDILSFDKNKKKKYDKYKSEYKNMISFLELTLKNVKNNFDSFCSSSSFSTSLPNTEEPEHKESIIKFNNETKQYYCDIDGVKLRGTIGNIYDKRILRNDRMKAHHVISCKYKNLCRNILRQEYCKFYHDPNDVLELKNAKVISEEYYNDIIKYTRNFSNTSWIFTSEPNEYMRSFGSGASLENDLKILELRGTKAEELDNFKAQVMHDLLVLKKIERP